MKLIAILGWLLLLTSFAMSEPSDIRVRIYRQQPVQQLTIMPMNGVVSFKTCAACQPKTLNHPLTIEAADSLIRGGKKTYSYLSISGSYRLDGSQHPRFTSMFPLEIRAQQGHLLTTLCVPLEEYVAAVVAAEAGNFDSDQALQAMAVAVRTFAVHFRGRHKSESFDFCDTTHCQDFHLSAVDDRIRAAVEATDGELLWYQGATAATYYHQNCGGRTADGNDVWPGHKLPYLSEHVDPYCSRKNSGNWQTTLNKPDLQKALLDGDLHPPDNWRTIEIQSRTQAGRVLKLRLVGDGSGGERVSASSFRFAVDRVLGWNQIRSDLYDVRDNGQQIVFSGRGSGHGVGMCQTGAVQMGHEGKSYRDILSFYYPGTLLGLTAQGIAWQAQSSERFELVSTHTRQDARLIPLGDRLMREAEAKSGLKFDFHPRLKVYPTLETYRDSTGEPGWVAASSRGKTIRMQPAELLQERAVLTKTLRHEFLHQLIESHARVGLPVWFREGLVLYLADDRKAPSSEMAADQMEAMLTHPRDRQQMELAYEAVHHRIATLVQRDGKDTVMSWLTRGLPSDIASPIRFSQASQN